MPGGSKSLSPIAATSVTSVFVVAVIAGLALFAGPATSDPDSMVRLLLSGVPADGFSVIQIAAASLLTCLPAVIAIRTTLSDDNVLRHYELIRRGSPSAWIVSRLRPVAAQAALLAGVAAGAALMATELRFGGVAGSIALVLTWALVLAFQIYSAALLLLLTALTLRRVSTGPVAVLLIVVTMLPLGWVNRLSPFTQASLDRLWPSEQLDGRPVLLAVGTSIVLTVLALVVATRTRAEML